MSESRSSVSPTAACARSPACTPQTPPPMAVLAWFPSFWGFMAGAMVLEWSHVFYACAAIISLNFLLLLTYKEQDKEERLAHRASVRRFRSSSRFRARPLTH